MKFELKKLIEKTFCFILGHDIVAEGNMDNGHSQFGVYRCLRCDKDHYWQYDK